jgi:metal-responsive CopG/Arc/MetJ family transcriptional regulator
MRIRHRRLQVMLTPEEFAALSDFQFQQRIPSRSAAIRELLRLGLTSKKRLRKKDRKKTTDFGVLDSSSEK